MLDAFLAGKNGHAAGAAHGRHHDTVSLRPGLYSVAQGRGSCYGSSRSSSSPYREATSPTYPTTCCLVVPQCRWGVKRRAASAARLLRRSAFIPIPEGEGILLDS